MTPGRIPSFTASLLVYVLCALVSPAGYSLDRGRSITQFYHTAWSEKNGAPSQIMALAQTTDGYLWIGSARGLFRFDGVKFEEYQPQPGVDLPSHNIYSLMATPDGGLWIAFRPTGTGFLKNGSLTVLTRPEEEPDSPIHSFALDHDGRLWAGTETGLELRQGTRWIPIGNDWNLPPEMVRDILVDPEGTLWVANMKTISFLKRGSKAFVPTGAVGKDVITFAQAPNGRVWTSDFNGVIRPVPISGRDSEPEDPAVVLNNLHKFLFDLDGALWITRSGYGLVRIRYPEKLGNRKLGAQDPELESFSEKDGLTGGLAIEILEDREGNIWVGCAKGLDRFRHSQVVPVTLPQPRTELTLQWANFYVITSTAAVTLLGLLGVVITLAAERGRKDTHSIRIYLTPAVIYLSCVLLLSALLSVPNQTRLTAVLCICLEGIAGLGYSGFLAVRRGASYQSRSDLFLYAVFPLAAYALMVGGGLLSLSTLQRGLDLVAAGILVLLGIGVRNSLSIATTIVSS